LRLFSYPTLGDWGSIEPLAKADHENGYFQTFYEIIIFAS